MEEQYHVRNTRTGKYLYVNTDDGAWRFWFTGLALATTFNRSDAKRWSMAWIRLTADHDIEITPVNP